MRFSGKKVFVTGSNRGIGKAIITKFASEGANIYAHARKENAEFEEYLKLLSSEYKILATPIYFDLTDSTQMKEAFKSVIPKTERIDVLVNNAGRAHGGFFSMTKVQTIRDVFEVNLFSAMELTQLVLRKMMRQGSGSIVNMSSVSAYNLRAGHSAYGVSKAAVSAWTETLAVETAPYGIRVNAVAPSLTDTDMAGQMEAKAGKEMIAQSAMGRMAKPEEIADVVCFLASDEASFVNGQTLRVTGGGKPD